MSEPSQILAQALQTAASGEHLSSQTMNDALGSIMDGHGTDVQIAGLLTALRMKGETRDEIVGAVRAMRARATKLTVQGPVVLDTCGTGGDGASTFNISTAVAFVCAASGVTVAKHGNRAISSRVGSADVLEALGVRIDISPLQVTQCIEDIGIGFMFAPAHHSALRHAAPVRKQLGFRTILNMLGPMTNPADATHQLIGVFDGSLCQTMAEVLGHLGSRRAMVVHGSDGLDEITIGGTTHAAFLSNGSVTQMQIDPRDYGFALNDASTLVGGEAETNAAIIRNVLGGQTGPASDIVRLNAGAALWVAEKAESLAEGVKMAAQLIDTGSAMTKLNALIAKTSDFKHG